jgi:nicotinic acid phosphoribosyltransferase
MSTIVCGGTNCSNDLKLAALSIVVKMTYIKKGGIWLPTVKLSDNLNKAIGPEDAIAERKLRYGHTHDNREVCVY